MLHTIFKIILIIFLQLNYSFAADYTSIPNDIDLEKRTFCDKGGKKFGHTIVLLDVTSKLDKPQIDFIFANIVSENIAPCGSASCRYLNWVNLVQNLLVNDPVEFKYSL